uniref:F-box domain-containing protein n=1 Tax=Onchocerca volvulus TaxID=6282 RepID=A0A8R1Y275_ONCVO
MWKKSTDGINKDTDHKNGISKESNTNNQLINDDLRSMYYPISEDFLRQKRRWKFLEWFPQCYHPCSINSLYLRLLAVPSVSHSPLPEDNRLTDRPLSMPVISRKFTNDAISYDIMLEDLPEHIHIEILKYVHPNDRFKKISLVSKYWYYIVNRVLSVILVEFFLNCFPNLEELNVEGTKTIGNSVYSTFLMKGFSNLKKLFISYSEPFFREDYRQFCLVNRPIEVLSVDGDAFLGNCSATYLSTSSFVNTLTRLYLDGEGLNDFGFHALTACKNLNLLSISFCEDLTDISLSYMKVDFDIEFIIIKNVVIFVWKADFGGTSSGMLTNLQHLHLRKGKEFTSEGLLELFELSNEDMGFFEKLRFLNLSECPSVNDNVVNRITKSCSKLQSLNLAWDWSVTDVGFTLITERLKELRFLDVTGMNSITSSALLYVPNLYLPNLRFLCVVQCPQFDETSLQMLQLRKKDLIIANYHCYYNTVTISGDEVSFGERCDSRYTYAVIDLLQQYQGFCCMSTLR